MSEDYDQGIYSVVNASALFNEFEKSFETSQRRPYSHTGFNMAL